MWNTSNHPNTWFWRISLFWITCFFHVFGSDILYMICVDIYTIKYLKVKTRVFKILWFHVEPMCTQISAEVDRKQVQLEPKLHHAGPKLGPSWAQVGAKWVKVGLQVVAMLPKFGPKWSLCCGHATNRYCEFGRCANSHAPCLGGKCPLSWSCMRSSIHSSGNS